MKQFLEAGKIVNTHGIRGEVKIQPWANSADFLCQFRQLYIDNKVFNVLSARSHKGCAVIGLEGVANIDEASALKNKIVYIDRDQAKLDDDEYFLQDIIGLAALSDATGEILGEVKDILPLPGGDVYVIKGSREILVPAVPEFIKEVDIPAGHITIHLIEGM